MKEARDYRNITPLFVAFNYLLPGEMHSDPTARRPAGFRSSVLVGCTLRTCCLWLSVLRSDCGVCRAVVGWGQVGERQQGERRVSPGSLEVPGPHSSSIQKWTHPGKPGPASLRTLYECPGWVPRRPTTTGNKSSVCPEYETADSFRVSLWRKRGWWMGMHWALIPTPRAGLTEKVFRSLGVGLRAAFPSEVLGGLRWPDMC